MFLPQKTTLLPFIEKFLWFLVALEVFFPVATVANLSKVPPSMSWFDRVVETTANGCLLVQRWGGEFRWR